MFSNFLFLLIVLLLVSVAPDAKPLLPVDAYYGFLFGGLVYFGCLGLIIVQNRLLKNLLSRDSLLILANLELISSLASFHLIFAGNRLFEKIPLLVNSQWTIAIYTLLLYFFGLFIYHYSSKGAPLRQLRFLVPFAIPFLTFSLILDFIGTSVSDLTIVLLTLLFLSLSMVFLPYIIKHLWKCYPLPDSELVQKLNLLCAKAHFRHGGMLSWTVMDPALTAAIIGVFPPFRYVMFTQSLIKKISHEEIEAVLAHEIGHSKHKHLFFYPFILLGMIVVATLCSFYLFPQPSLLLIFIIYSVVAAAYFRIVFGYFSRLFERQADLYVFALDLPAQYMIDALHHIAVETGNSHLKPSWHHYSIQQRIDFLKQASQNPDLIRQHKRKIFWSLLIYFILLSIGIFLIL